MSNQRRLDRVVRTPSNKFGTNNRRVVNLNQPDGQGASHNGVNPINMDAQGGNSNAADAAGRVRMIFINEWAEILMDLTNGKWNGGDSSGEGLSQFCGMQRFQAGHYCYYPSFVSTWLNTAPRPNWVDRTEGTDKDQPVSSAPLHFFLSVERVELHTTTNHCRRDQLKYQDPRRTLSNAHRKLEWLDLFHRPGKHLLPCIFHALHFPGRRSLPGLPTLHVPGSHSGHLRVFRCHRADLP
jgi:hypothetical protein